ncbi:MAG: hypothetical protein HKO57_16700, partial [Akkermansiaceae bacterium]|nr:hypothetical protein [Akkermansiaceae bacterium]
RRGRLWARLTFLAAATFVLWLALIVGVEYGYNAWQSSPNPPDEAFSDTGGPFATLFLGWVPSALVLGIVYLLLRWCWRSLAPPPAQPPPLPSSPA